MSLVRGKDTGPEKKVGDLLRRMGIRYKTQADSLPGRPDVFFPRKKKAIFVHGCFWHRHTCPRGRIPKTRKVFWESKLESNRKRDARVCAALRATDWNTMVVWECQLSRPEVVSRRLKKFISCAA